jgi:hypothetical protein
VLLDKEGGPTCIGPSSDSVCTPLIGLCDAPILADAATQTLEVTSIALAMTNAFLFSLFVKKK